MVDKFFPNFLNFDMTQINSVYFINNIVHLVILLKIEIIVRLFKIKRCDKNLVLILDLISA
jgi:hypothetical protein